MPGRDPLKYFRIEVRELLDGLERGLLPLERGGEAGEFGAPLLRLAHTLKGAARVVRQQEIADLAHQFEEELHPHIERPGPLATPVVDTLARQLQRIAQLVAVLGESAPAPASAASMATSPETQTETAPAQPVVDERFETVRVAVADLETLLATLSALNARVAGLAERDEGLDRVAAQAGALAALLAPARRQAAEPAAATAFALERARAQVEELQRTLADHRRATGDAAARLDDGLRDAREQVDALRLLPAASLFASLEAAARDVARQLGKRIDFQVSGGEHRLDAQVLGPLREALAHLVRNAVDHGIESETERAAAGKPAAGQVMVRVERRGQRIVFLCRDDGRGLDVAALRSAAVARGRVSAGDAAALDGAGLARLLLAAGFSSRREVPQISGRGIGLDTVRATILQLKGNLTLNTTAGGGTEVEIDVPLSLSALDALRVEAGGHRAWLPLACVRAVLSIQSDAAAPDAAASGALAATPEGERISHEGRALPYVPLAELLPGGATAPARLAVVIEVASQRLAIGVERLAGSAHIVVRPLPATLGALPLIEGAAFDAEGHPEPVLEPAGLAAAARTVRARREPPPAAAPASILVIDDSLTTRMLEQSILEGAGYRVELAVCAEEGLEKARRQHYDLFVVDVEMPGLTGFEFVATTRADPQLRETPAILVTSCAAPEDRRRGLEVGARAYVVKGEFDQDEFLAIVRGLVD